MKKVLFIVLIALLSVGFLQAQQISLPEIQLRPQKITVLVLSAINSEPFLPAVNELVVVQLVKVSPTNVKTYEPYMKYYTDRNGTVTVYYHGCDYFDLPNVAYTYLAFTVRDQTKEWNSTCEPLLVFQFRTFPGSNN